MKIATKKRKAWWCFSGQLRVRHGETILIYSRQLSTVFRILNHRTISGRSGSNCFSGDTTVRTFDGKDVQLRDVNLSDWVMTKYMDQVILPSNLRTRYIFCSGEHIHKCMRICLLEHVCFSVLNLYGFTYLLVSIGLSGDSVPEKGN